MKRTCKYKWLLLALILLIGNAVKGYTTEYAHEKITTHVSHDCVLAGENIWFTVFVSDKRNISENKISNLAFVEFVDINNRSIIRKKVILEKGVGTGSLQLPDSISSGIYNLIVYTNWLKNFGESSFSKSKILVIKPGEELKELSIQKETEYISASNKPEAKLPFDLVLNKDNFSKREKVEVDFEFNDAVSAFKSGVFSVSVNKKVPEQIIFMTQNISSESMDEIDSVIYYPDYKGVLISGKLLEKFNDNPISGKEIILSFPGKSVEIEYAITDENGNFKFLIDQVEGNKELVFILPDENCRLKLDDLYWNGFDNLPVNDSLTTNIESKEFVKNKFIADQLRKKFKQKNYSPAVKEEIPSSFSFYGEPYQSLLFSDFIKLDSLTEYFYELIPTVHFVKRKGIYDIYLTDPESKFSIGDSPAVFVDGVLYSDYGEIAKLDQNLVEMVEVIPVVYYYRDKSFDGIVSIFTKKGDFNSVPILSNMVRVEYPVSEIANKFKSPDYESDKSELKHTPDLRQLLHWQTKIKYEEGNPLKISFFTGDETGEFEISVVGIGENGKILEIGTSIFVN